MLPKIVFINFQLTDDSALLTLLKNTCSNYNTNNAKVTYNTTPVVSNTYRYSCQRLLTKGLS